MRSSRQAQVAPHSNQQHKISEIISLTELRTQNFDTFVCCCCFDCCFCCCCCWDSGTLHVAVNGPGHWLVETNAGHIGPWLDCLMLLAKGPILISILINFGTFEKQSQHSCQQPQMSNVQALAHAHNHAQASMTISQYYMQTPESMTPTFAMYIQPQSPPIPVRPKVALFVLEILLQQAIYSGYIDTNPCLSTFQVNINCLIITAFIFTHFNCLTITVDHNKHQTRPSSSLIVSKFQNKSNISCFEYIDSFYL